MPEHNDYDVLKESMSYATIQTNSLFEDSKPALKISRFGGSVNIRIPWVSIIWGGAFGFIIGIPLFILYVIVLGAPLLLSPPFIVLFGIAILAGARLGNWSPLSKTTGEDLPTWLRMKARQRLIERGAITGKKPSTTQLYSLAVGPSGRLVDCTLYIGTQPLTDAPPMTAKRGEQLISKFEIYPTGEYYVLPDDTYDDGIRG